MAAGLLGSVKVTGSGWWSWPRCWTRTRWRRPSPGRWGSPGSPGRPALETMLDALAPQDLLIVLDNCEHLIDSCAKMAEAILRRCPRVRLLATSREPLAIGGETIYRVPPLSLPGPGDRGLAAAESCDAVALFADRARAQGGGLRVDEQTAPVVVSICRRLDGMPLAIELAAARLRSLSLTGLHDRLDQRFGLLTGGSRTALERQQTLRATVDWSYSLLTGTEQVAAGPPVGVRRELRPGRRRSGVRVRRHRAVRGRRPARLAGGQEPGGGRASRAALRYRLLETIRQFAAERLAETGPDEAAAVAAAHCAHFLTVAEAAAPHLTGPDQGSWLARLDADQANLRRAAAHAAADPDGTAQVLRLGVALERYWLARSRIARSKEQEAFGLLVPALERPDARADPALFAAALAYCRRRRLVRRHRRSTAPWRTGRRGRPRPGRRPAADQVPRGTVRHMLLRRRAGDRAPLRAGGCRARPPSRRRRPAGRQPALVSAGRRPCPAACSWSARRLPAPSEPATISLTPSCTTTPATLR